VNFWLFILVYLLGILLGVLASMYLNLQLRRPGLTKSIALVVFGTLLTVFIVTHNTTMPEGLLILLWAGIGALAGLGSQENRRAL
jgi:hypothetical protein